MTDKRVIASEADFNRLIDDELTSRINPVWLLSVKSIVLSFTIVLTPALFATTSYPFFYTGPQGFAITLVAIVLGVALGFWRSRYSDGKNQSSELFGLAVLFAIGYSYATAGVISLQGQNLGFPLLSSFMFAIGIVSTSLTLQVKSIILIYKEMDGLNQGLLFKQIASICSITSLVYAALLLPISFKGYEPIFIAVIFLILSLRFGKRLILVFPLAVAVVYVAYIVNYQIGMNIINLSGKDSRIEIEQSSAGIRAKLINNIEIPNTESLYNNQLALNLISVSNEREKVLVVGGIQGLLLKVIASSYDYKILSSDILATSLISSLEPKESKKLVHLTSSILPSLIDDDTKYSVITEFIYEPLDDGGDVALRMRFAEYKRMLDSGGRIILQYPKQPLQNKNIVKSEAQYIFNGCVDISAISSMGVDALVCST